MTDSLTGLYLVSYVPRLAGTYSVSVLYNRLPIFGSPYTTVVRPGRAAASRTVVPCASQPKPESWSLHSPCGATLGIAGEVSRFVVTARDSNDNDCRVGGENVEAFLIAPPTAAGSQLSAAGAAGVRATVLDTSDGGYSATYRVTAAGVYEMAVSIDGQPIKGSPFATTVRPGATCAGLSTLSGGGRSSAVAGTSAQLTIRAVDCYGNAQTAGGDPFTVVLTRPGVPNVLGAVIDRGNGTYSVTYNATIRGLWQLATKAGGVHVVGSPHTVLVLPAPTDAAATIAVGEGTSLAYIGETSVVMVRTKDMYGNDRASGGDHVTATLSQPSTNSLVHADVVDTKDGSYSLRCEPHVDPPAATATATTTTATATAATPFHRHPLPPPTTTLPPTSTAPSPPAHAPPRPATGTACCSPPDRIT